MDTDTHKGSLTDQILEAKFEKPKMTRAEILVKAREARKNKPKVEPQVAAPQTNGLMNPLWHDVMMAQIKSGKLVSPSQFATASWLADEYVKFCDERFQ